MMPDTLEAFERLPNDEQLQVLQELSSTLLSVSSSLLRYPHTQIRKAIVQNFSAPAEILTVLSSDSSVEIRFGVALHQNTSIETLKKLSEDKSAHVRWGIAYNQKTPVEILEILAKDKVDVVRGKAHKRLRELNA